MCNLELGRCPRRFGRPAESRVMSQAHRESLLHKKGRRPHGRLHSCPPGSPGYHSKGRAHLRRRTAIRQDLAQQAEEQSKALFFTIPSHIMPPRLCTGRLETMQQLRDGSGALAVACCGNVYLSQGHFFEIESADARHRQNHTHKVA